MNKFKGPIVISANRMPTIVNETALKNIRLLLGAKPAPEPTACQKPVKTGATPIASGRWKLEDIFKLPYASERGIIHTKKDLLSRNPIELGGVSVNYNSIQNVIAVRAPHSATPSLIFVLDEAKNVVRIDAFAFFSEPKMAAKSILCVLSRSDFVKESFVELLNL